jgi:hypothetical protein
MLPEWTAFASDRSGLISPQLSGWRRLSVNVHEAKDGKPLARLVPLETDRRRRQPWLPSGQLQLPAIEVLLAPLAPEKLAGPGAPLPC